MRFAGLLSRIFNGKILLIAGLIAACTFAHAQDVKVTGGFLSDSIKIGEETAFYLSAKYPRELNIIFPDSTFQFGNFELIRKKYFPTTSTQEVSQDSAIYYMTTYEVDRKQGLQLPVFGLNERDCTQYVSNPDTILITQLVAQVPDSVSADKLPLKMNTAYQKVFFEFNYIVLAIVVGVLIVVLIVVWIIFGKRIRKFFQAKRLQKQHVQFLERYNKLVTEVRAAFSTNTTETALFTWKKYMEQLDASPYTKLTTTELLARHPDDGLGKNLRAVDNAIYGYNKAVAESLDGLKSFADQRFQQKLQEVKNG